MRSSFFSMLVFLGTILLSFGLVIFIIQLLASLNGVRHDIAWILAIGCLGGLGRLGRLLRRLLAQCIAVRGSGIVRPLSLEDAHSTPS